MPTGAGLPGTIITDTERGDVVDARNTTELPAFKGTDITSDPRTCRSRP